MSAPSTAPLLGIAGPTASGKSELAMALATRLPAEIVVADSRQVYRGMDVGTAKPDRTARATVRHHLVDVVDPDERFTVADWMPLAREAIASIRARAMTPLLVGGTGLYVTSLLDGYDFAAPPSPATRAGLLAALEADGVDALAQRLRAADPAAAARTDLRNPRRVVRALERIEEPPSRVGHAPATVPARLVALARPRDVLYRRIDQRAADLFASGLLAEVRRLLDAGYAPELAPLRSHGYLEAIRCLAGEWSLEQAIAETARRTRQHAKRQLTWFRRDPRITWLDAGAAAGDDPSIVAAALDSLLETLIDA